MRWSSGGRGISSGADRGGDSSGRGSEGVGGGGKGPEERLNAMDYNNAYVEGRWGLFQNAVAMRVITCKASLVGINLPASPIDPT